MSQEKVALITGANKGLGLEIARQLGKSGVQVIIGSRDLERGEAAVEELKKDGVHARAVKLDVTSKDDIAALPKWFEREFGRLDILVNNAGVMTENWQKPTVASVSAQEMRATFDSNFFGTVELTQSLLPLLRQSPAARIVNQSSILGSLTAQSDLKSPYSQTKPFAYDASKAALNSFTVHLSYELRDTNIKVNSAHPGWVKTDLGSDAAPMNVQDGAKTAVRLALLDDDGPSGSFFHMEETLPW